MQERAWKPLDIVVVAIVIFVPSIVIYAHFTSFLQEKEGKNVLIELENIKTNQVEKLQIFDDDTKELLLETNSEESIQAFCASLKSLDDWHPDHSSFIKTFYVVLHTKDERKFEFLMSFKSQSDRTMYIDGIRRSGKSAFSCLYRKKSNILYDWFVSNGLMKPLR